MAGKETALTPEGDIQPESEEWVSLNSFKEFKQAGDWIEGNMVGRTEILMDERPVGQYLVLTAAGIVTFNETIQLSVLRNVPPGAEVQVIYTGEENITGGRRVRNFDINVRRKTLPHLGAGKASAALSDSSAPGDSFADPFAEG